MQIWLFPSNRQRTDFFGIDRSRKPDRAIPKIGSTDPESRIDRYTNITVGLHGRNSPSVLTI